MPAAWSAPKPQRWGFFIAMDGMYAGNAGENSRRFALVLAHCRLHVEAIRLHVKFGGLHVDAIGLHLEYAGLHAEHARLHVDAIGLHLDPIGLPP